jgi:hypothetical protein
LDGSFTIFCDNQGLVNTCNSLTASTQLANMAYAAYIYDIRHLLSELTDRVTIVWIAAHVGFPGNEVADAFANYFSCCPHQHSEPAQHSPFPNVQGLLCLGRVPKVITHRNIDVREWADVDCRSSFLTWTKCGPFSNSPFKFIQGILQLPGYEFCDNLDLCDCSSCGLEAHAGDTLSSLAFCSLHEDARAIFHDFWPASFVPVVKDWLTRCSEQDARKYFRTLVPISLRTHAFSVPPLVFLMDDKERHSELHSICSDRATKFLKGLNGLTQMLVDNPPRLHRTGVPGPDSWTKHKRTFKQFTLASYVPGLNIPPRVARPRKKKKRKK